MTKYLSVLFLILYFCLYSSATSIELQDENGNRNPTLGENNDVLVMTVIADFGTYKANGIELYITYNSDLLEVIESPAGPFDYKDGKFNLGIPVINKISDDKKNQIGFAAIIMPNQSLPTGPDNEIAKVKFNVQRSYFDVEIDEKEEEIKIGKKEEVRNLDEYVESGFADKVHWKIANGEELRKSEIVVGDHLRIDSHTLIIKPSDVWRRVAPIEVEVQASLDTDESQIYFNHSQRDRDKNRYTFYTSLEGENPERSFDKYFDSKINVNLGEKTFTVSAISFPPKIKEILKQEVELGQRVQINLSDYVEDSDTNLSDIEWTAESMDEDKVSVKVYQDVLIISAKQFTDQLVEIKLAAEDPSANKDETSISVKVIPVQREIKLNLPKEFKLDLYQKDKLNIELWKYFDPVELFDKLSWKINVEPTDIVSAKIENNKTLVVEGIDEGEAKVTVSATLYDERTIEDDIVVTTVFGNFTGKIIVNPIIPTFLHIVVISKDEVNIPVLYAKLNVKEEPIELERKDKIWIGVYKRTTLDEKVEIQSIKTKKTK